VAIYYMNVQIIGRSAGRTATGAAAYRAGERIVDERTGQVFDYTRRRGEIETEILAPEGAPAWAQDRAQLWNRAEAVERRGDAQVAREMVVAFPKELNPDQQWELVRAYVREEFVSKGMVADVAIHRNPGNPHAHIMLTMREIGPEGFSAKKNREWNKPELLERWREEWAVQSNRALERAGREERIDHRSLQEQGVERLPQVHLGPHASALERQGVATEKGDHNRVVAEHNAVVLDLEKARQERQALRVEKAIQERTAARINAGWLPVHAQALGQLEVRAKGRELTADDLREYRETYGGHLQSVNQEIAAINQEGERLGYAQRALERHQEALNQLRPHETILRTAKRLFSPEARAVYQHAQNEVKYAQTGVERWGIKDFPDLARRQGEWEQQRAKLPKLESKADTLHGALGLIDKALEGFSRAMERARRSREREDRAREDWWAELERKKERSRDSDRGR
jgi:ATP-dependent exoDNAse (exonuclease V) alpha subunit